MRVKTLKLLVIVMSILLFYVFFFFNQTTAYEMRISDWSSDVFSSDLALSAVSFAGRFRRPVRHQGPPDAGAGHGAAAGVLASGSRQGADGLLPGTRREKGLNMADIDVFNGDADGICALTQQIGRAHV